MIPAKLLDIQGDQEFVLQQEDAHAGKQIVQFRTPVKRTTDEELGWPSLKNDMDLASTRNERQR